MKTLVVYYSLSGNTRFIARTIADEIQADILELKTKSDAKMHGFMKYFWGGKQVMMHEKPELESMGKNPADYDLIFIGTPVWAWTFTPALSSFFFSVPLAGKKIALFCSHGGGMKNTLKDMEAQLGGNEIIGSRECQEPMKNNKEACIKKIKDWTREVVRLAS